jgi:hypothetical protein
MLTQFLGGLSQGNPEHRLSLTCACSQKMRAQGGFASAGSAADEVDVSSEQPTSQNVVEAGNASWHSIAGLTCRHSSSPSVILHKSKNNAIHDNSFIFLDKAISCGMRLLAHLYQNEKSLVCVIILIDSIWKGHEIMVHGSRAIAMAPILGMCFAAL